MSQKKSLFLVMILQLVFFHSQLTFAANLNGETGVGIGFEENSAGEPQKPVPPIIDEQKPGINNPKEGYLPALGQAITSFTLLLLGIACIIILFGVYSLRKIYSVDEYIERRRTS